ncbi:MAG: hypothetical protein IT158_25580 [Bryobacterales bacterium]|nr:hypothetical protein [Bryobacterales bacterium]
MRVMPVLALFAASGLLVADTLQLRNGKTVTGTYLGGTSRQVRMEIGDRIETYAVSEVSSIEFQTATAAEPAAASKPQERVTLTPSGGTAAKSTAAAPATAGSLEIPSGTTVTVRMIDSVDSETSQVGQEFKASLDEPVMVGGKTAIARGADVVVKLVEDKQAGRLTGRTELTLDLVSVKVGDRMVDINTQAVTTSSESRTKRTGAVAGGTAALGAIIGGIAGGGRGAAIGAITGAGAGTAVQVMTKGPTVRIPSETRLTFTLQDTVRI